jgi:hypothetical protein
VVVVVVVVVVDDNEDDSVWQESMRPEVEHSWTFLFHLLGKGGRSD